MKVILEISDEEITREAQRILVQKLAEQIFEQRNSFDKHGYQRAIKDAVKELLADRVDEVAERAAAYTAEYIGKRGVRKILASLAKEAGDGA